jgi:hypothetical protein
LEFKVVESGGQNVSAVFRVADLDAPEKKICRFGLASRIAVTTLEVPSFI